MKSIFYTFVFLSLAVLAQAQNNISYISFFPPASIAHSHVYLTQDNASFKRADLINNTNSNNYHSRRGGLILGAANGAKVSISTITIQSASLDFAISKFWVDNIVRVSNSNGRIKNLTVGLTNGTTEVISVANFKWPTRAEQFSGSMSNYDINVSERATLASLKVPNANNTAYMDIIPLTIPTNNNGSSTRNITTSDTLAWRKLRINGSEKCLWYLTVNSPSSDNCREPEAVNSYDPGMDDD